MNKFPIVTEFASAEVPLFLEKKNKNIVWFGVDNMYPFELIDLYNDSSTHNAIINGKVGYIVGNGLFSDDLEVKKWLSQANIDEDWTLLMKRLCLDYELFNGYAIEVIKTKVGNQYHHIDFANIRVGLDGSLQYSDEWITDKGTRNSKPKIQYLERYNPRDAEQKRGVIYHVDYRPNLKYYPLPVYVGSLAEIRTDVQIGDYWLNEVQNGFVGGTLIQHNNGVPETKDEADSFEKAFQEKFGKATGTKIVHLFSPSKDNASEITNMNGNDLHSRYIEMSNRVKESIFIGHRITNPILFGVKEEGQLGARNELDLAYEIFTNTYIAERQNTLLRTIKKLAFYEIQNPNIEILPLKPIDTIDLTSDIILSNLNRSEIRDLINEQTGLELEEEAEPEVQMSKDCDCDNFDDDDPCWDGYEMIGMKIKDGKLVPNCVKIKDDMAKIIKDNKPLFDTKEEAEKVAKEIGCEGYHEHDIDGKTWYMPCSTHSELKQIDKKKKMSACSCFSKDEDISHLFDKIGVAEKEYEIIDSLDIFFDDDGSPMEFATKEQGLVQRMLTLIRDNKVLSGIALADSLDLSFDQLINSVNVLKKADMITITGSDIRLTKLGDRLAKSIDLPKLEVKYRYELRPDAPDLKKDLETGETIGKSRDFCIKMMEKEKLYSKQEIELLRNDMDADLNYPEITNVWLSRGGWYRKPIEVKGEAPYQEVPYCRHIWKQVLVRKK